MMMKKIAFTLMFVGIASLSLQAQTRWVFDKAHTSVGFSVSHMVISETTGTFKDFSGTVTSSNDDFTGSTIEFTADIASINTDNERRDGHLKSPDFFDAEKFPKMTFKSTSFEKVEGNKYKLVGDLTIKDVTKSVELEVKYGGSINTQRGTKAGFKATGTIDRFDFNLKWDRTMDSGGLVVGKEVDLVINVELNQEAS